VSGPCKAYHAHSLRGALEVPPEYWISGGDYQTNEKEERQNGTARESTLTLSTQFSLSLHVGRPLAFIRGRQMHFGLTIANYLTRPFCACRLDVNSDYLDATGAVG
jgi:hypothetical protein